MLIKSQDGKKISSDMNLEVTENRGKYIIENEIYNWLAEYSTKENVEKALEQFVQWYSVTSMMEHSIDFHGTYRAVFTFPTDEEVTMIAPVPGSVGVGYPCDK